MVLQVEDCIDVMKVLYPEFDVCFYFDHSCGHDRQRPYALNGNRMNVKFGGSQPIIHDSAVQEVGQHEAKLRVGDVQHFDFKEGDDGLFWMNDDERHASKHEISTGQVAVVKRENKN